ncbi:MAG: TonB-dependent receptor [Prolixibacteraceae bacterium]
MRIIKYKSFILLVPSLLFVLISFSVQAQIKITGQVLEAGTNQPINSFTIRSDSADFHFQDGSFQLSGKQIPVQLVVKAPGYYSLSYTVNHIKSKLTLHLIPENVNIQEVTVKAFHSYKRLNDTPGAIDLITNRQLIEEPTFTLAPSVNKIPGVWMQSGSINTNRLTIRGIGTRSPYGSNKIRAYYGEIPLTNGVGETTLEDLDLEQIADIEIIKGPSSGFYGSGLGGVLLFNPAKPTASQVLQQVSVGSFATVKYTAKLTLAGKNSGSSLVYSRFHTDGYRENNTGNRHNLTWTSSVEKNQTKIDLLASFVKMDAYIPSSIDLKTYTETPQKAAANWAAAKGYEDYTTIFGGASVQQKFSKNWLASVSGFGHYNKNNELRPFNILQENNHYFGMRSVLEKKYVSKIATSRIMVGNEFFTENYLWQTLQNNNRTAGNLLSDNVERRWYNNFFLLTDLNFQDKFLVSASLNYNQTHYNYADHFLVDGDQGGNHRFSPVVSPRLAATWVLSERFRFYSVVSQGFSPPTLEETLMPGGQRNLAIKPETGWNYELGMKMSVSKSLYIEGSAYYMKIKNLLVARRTGEDEYMGINAGATNHPGLEFKLDYKFIDRPQWIAFFRMNANMTRYRFADFVDNGTDYSGNKLTGTPSSVTNWMLEATHATGFFLNLHFQTVGKMPMLDDNSLFSTAYQLGNLMTGYERTFQKLTVSLSSGIQNLFDEHYASMILINAVATGNNSPRFYYPGLPRNFKSMVSLRYLF